MSLVTASITEPPFFIKQEKIEEEQHINVNKETANEVNTVFQQEPKIEEGSLDIKIGPSYKTEIVLVKEEPKKFKEVHIKTEFNNVALLPDLVEETRGKKEGEAVYSKVATDENQSTFMTIELSAAQPICQPVPAYAGQSNTPQEYDYQDNGKQTKNNLTTHIDKQSDLREECQICKKRVLPVNMRQHVSTHDETRVRPLYDCTFCNKTYRTKQSLDVHIAGHTGELNYGCNQCSLRFPTKNKASRHAIVHKPEQYVCDVCHKRFRRRNNFNDHKRLHLKKEFECEICHKEFALKWYLTQHMRTHTGERNFNCDSCAKTFKSKTNLNRHKQTHIKNKHGCDLCHESFPNLHSLKSHRDTHTGGRPHVCETCGQRFLLRSTMLDHTKMHTADQYKCKVCGDKFPTRSIWRKHRRMHRETRFCCDYCTREFDLKQVLEEHVKGHLGMAAYKCAECGAAYAHASSFYRHMRTRHSMAKPVNKTE